MAFGKNSGRVSPLLVIIGIASLVALFFLGILFLVNAPVGTLEQEQPSKGTPSETAEINALTTEEPVFNPASPLAPSGQYKTFDDAVLMISFEYPDNWFVTPSSSRRDTASLQNTDPSHPQEGETSARVKLFNLEIQPLPDVAEDVSLDEYVTAVANNLPKGYLISKENIRQVDGNQAIQITYKDIPAPENLFSEIYVKKRGRFWHFRFYPPDSEYSNVLTHFLDSIHLP